MTNDQRKAYFKAYHLKHRAKKCADRKAWAAAHVDHRRAYDRQYRIDNRDRRNATEARYRERNRLAIQARRFGLTRDELSALYEAQHGACAICDAHDVRLCVDHDHVTGIVRGLLCGTCNSAIGLLRESPTILAKAAMYLAHYEKGQRESA